MLLDEAQLTTLEHLVQSLDVTLHVEEAVLDDSQTLTLMLCTDTVCLPPLRLTALEVDIPAALAGHPAAQAALGQQLRLQLPGLL